MGHKHRNALIVFVKYPEPGKVKTRLGADIGIERATEIYRIAAEFVAKTFSSSYLWETFFFYTPENRKKETLKWLANVEGSFFAQQGKSLGQRISHAFAKCFSLGFCNVVVIGTDCVLITKKDLETAFSILSEKKFRAVLGPASDGGYYLLGLCEKKDRVFSGIPWSSESVLSETQRILREDGVYYQTLRTLCDIDEESDICIEEIENRDWDLGQRFRSILNQ